VNERRRLAVALTLPALVVLAMFFVPLDDVARGNAAARGNEAAQAPSILDRIFARGSGTAGGIRRSTTPVAGEESYDWADILKLDGITYSAGLLNGGRALRDDDLGGEVGRVSFRLNGSVPPIGYVPKDGDAAYLDPGTPLYGVNGYLSSFRLAARRAGRLVLFEAVTNPNAHTGRDLLDIDGKVKSVALDENDPRAIARSIDRPEEVATLVEMVLNARVEPGVKFGKRTEYVSFRLLDGTAVTFQFAGDAGNLSRGITGLPREFASLLAPNP
jgi:hypothetical protein